MINLSSYSGLSTFKRNLRTLLLSIAVLSLALLLAVSLVIAQDDDDPDGSIRLSVSPQIIELSANPGQQLNSSFRLTNGSDEPIVIDTSVRNFTAQGEDGAVQLTEEDTGFSLAGWTTVSPATVNMDAGQSQDFDVTIDVPDNAEPRGQFSAVVFQTVPEERADGATVSQEIAPLVLVRVAGDAEESAEVASFATGQTLYSLEDTIDFEARIENTGNVFFGPSGTIEIKNMFGSVVAELPLEERNVLPDAVRRIPAEWDVSDGWNIGRYTAQLTAVYGEDNQILTAETSFTIFPYQIIAPVVLAVLVIGAVLWRIRRRIRAAWQVLRAKPDNDE